MVWPLAEETNTYTLAVLRQISLLPLLIKANNGNSVPYESLFGLRMQLDHTQANF